MVELLYDGTLGELFTLLAGICRGAPLPDRVRRMNSAAGPPEQPELFGAIPGPGKSADPALDYALPASGNWEQYPPIAAEFFEISADACDAFLHAWLSELPIEADLLRFAWKVIAASRDTARAGSQNAGRDSPRARRAAESAAADRGDPVVRVVREAAYKVRHEVHRLLGLLRFNPNRRGIYTARCAPDYGILPLLGEHFFRRFGKSPWAVIDEKRGRCILCPCGDEPRLLSVEEALPLIRDDPETDPWEALWKNYHRSINNESRTNPRLQRQFMPQRYWKYLPEAPGKD
jgi:hypothetical protein